jgi:hypothetical protein
MFVVLIIILVLLVRQTLQKKIYEKIKKIIQKMEIDFNYAKFDECNKIKDTDFNECSKIVWIVANIENVPQKGHNSGFTLSLNIFKNHQKSLSNSPSSTVLSKLSKDCKYIIEKENNRRYPEIILDSKMTNETKNSLNFENDINFGNKSAKSHQLDKSI